MQALKNLVAALAIAAVITPAQADDRAVVGAVIAGVITYHVLKQQDEPRVIVQQQPQVIIVQPLRQPVCYLRQAYSAPGQGAVYVQECRY